MNDAMQVRNALAHGMTLPAINPDVPQHVVSVARRLLAESGEVASSA